MVPGRIGRAASEDNGLTVWPADWPRFHNASNEPCDMLLGPCCCGAWHSAGEFEVRDDRLFRDGRPVATMPAPPVNVVAPETDPDFAGIAAKPETPARPINWRRVAYAPFKWAGLIVAFPLGFACGAFLWTLHGLAKGFQAGFRTLVKPLPTFKAGVGCVHRPPGRIARFRASGPDIIRTIRSNEHR